MTRALLIVLDSVGCGGAPDAEKYGDVGANTLGHILEAIPDLKIPNLKRLGLGKIMGFDDANEATYARMSPLSRGKDTTSGHWEIAGAVLTEPFAVFEKFPDELVHEIEHKAHIHFIGNIAASGTQILEMMGEQSVASGRPILYTSADSVIQIAAHEAHFGLEKLYHVCEIARTVADKWQIGRVIARPFIGEIGNWSRTTNRRDFSLVPPATILNQLFAAEIPTVGIGKISDIFAGSGLSESHPTKSNAAGMETIKKLWQSGRAGFFFANLVDFDSLFGHRRDIPGYANALEEFDIWFGGFLPNIEENDLVLITADHGNDPTWAGTDHTREQVPLLLIHRNRRDDAGVRHTFADISASLADYFGVEWSVGTSLLAPNSQPST